METDGTASAVEVVRSVSASLDSAAVAAVAAARFTPGRQNGVPVRVRQALPVTFRITRTPAPFDAATLLAQLGQRWADTAPAQVPADSGAAERGAGRLVWRDGPDLVEALVANDTLQTVAIRFGDPARMEGVRGPAVRERVPVQPDGFMRAQDLAAKGLPAQVDLRLDGQRLVMRQATCQDVPGYGCVRDFPTLIGGTQGLLDRVMSQDGPTPVGRRRFDVTFVVQPDGSVSDARLVSPPDRTDREVQALAEAVLRAVRGSRFVPARRGTEAVAAPSVATLTMR